MFYNFLLVNCAVQQISETVSKINPLLRQVVGYRSVMSMRK